MADNKQTKFYRTKILGLSVVVGDPKEGEVAPETIRFSAYKIQSELGEDIHVAYLKTDNAVAIKKLSNDPNVTEVEQSEFEKYTNLEDEKIQTVGV